jgi:hypothetical protein
MWSKDVNGLLARLSLKRGEVFNGTPIMSAYLELHNSSDIANPISINWPGKWLKFSVTRDDGKNVPPSGLAYDGMIVEVPDLILPFDSTIRINVSQHGAGVEADRAALLDFGGDQCWSLPRDGGQYTLSAVLEIPTAKDPPGNNPARPWHGRIEIPGVSIFPREGPIDPALVGPRIDELGTEMLDKNSLRSDQAVRELSLIDDPRAIPWYIKAMNTDSYELKFAALDRLCRFSDAAALEGLRKGLMTRSADIGNCTSGTEASSMAENIREEAIDCLARSPLPQAKVLLFSMAQDADPNIRMTVAQAASQMISDDSLNVLEKLAQDADASVRTEATRCLSLRLSHK